LVTEIENHEVIEKAKLAKAASRQLARLNSKERRAILFAMADSLLAAEAEVLKANQQDVERVKAAGVATSFIDRLMLTPSRIADMANGLKQVAALPDTLGEVVRAWRLPNGLDMAQVRVPLGVVAVIYEGRPNVTADVIGLCIKTGNATVLRGSSDAIESNKVIASVMAQAAECAGMPIGAIQLIHDTDRASARQLMRLNGLIDCLIPRGGKGLIQAAVQNATVPVVETGIGICHVYVDADADLTKALPIIINAKVQRPSVCNAMETLLVHKDVAETFLPLAGAALAEHGVKLIGCPRACSILPQAIPATEEDWATEYLDLILSIRVVDNVAEAIDHIEKYGSHHSDAIVTENYSAARQFTAEVDSAAVYVNASTRFTDGFEFGFGAEIGISTQKLHARGPMGLAELMTTKYVVQGDGQIRG
jgi:glutamate-5-semialdehyde dehydrogenase